MARTIRGILTPCRRKISRVIFRKIRFRSCSVMIQLPIPIGRECRVRGSWLARKIGNCQSSHTCQKASSCFGVNSSIGLASPGSVPAVHSPSNISFKSCREGKSSPVRAALFVWTSHRLIGSFFHSSENLSSTKLPQIVPQKRFPGREKSF